MKTRSTLLIMLAAGILAAPTMQAQSPSKASKAAQAKLVVKDRELSRLTFEEMMKDSEKKRYMARVMAKDKEAREAFFAEVGSDAPHEERNPADHPELFHSKQP